MLREDQYKELSNRGLNLSGLVRDMIDDHLGDSKIIVRVSQETRDLYDKIISNTGAENEELEVYLRNALKEMLSAKIENMQNLAKSLEDSE